MGITLIERNIVDGAASTARRNTLPVALACACAGIIIGIVTS